MRKTTHLLLLISLIWTFPSTAQEFSKKEIRKNRPSYVLMGAGLDAGSFLDLATSPLTYRGVNLNMHLGHLKEDSVIEGQFGFNYFVGLYVGGTGNHYSSSIANGIYLSYKRLYQLPLHLSSNTNLKIGGEINTLSNFRYNASLQNNGFGMEYFGNLMGVIKLTQNISRDEPRTIHIWKVNLHLKPKQRNLSFQGNLGLANFNLRNGYAYTGQSQVVNDFNAFEGYQFNKFSGLRIGGTAAYTRYLNNGNGIRWAYTFDALTSGETVNRFALARNTITFTLLFKTN